jgi:hypothetical protein
MNIAHSRLISFAGLTKLRLIQSDLVIWDNRHLTSLEVRVTGVMKDTATGGANWLFQTIWSKR